MRIMTLTLAICMAVPAGHALAWCDEVDRSPIAQAKCQCDKLLTAAINPRTNAAEQAIHRAHVLCMRGRIGRMIINGQATNEDFNRAMGMYGKVTKP